MSNGYDIFRKQIRETAAFTPEPSLSPYRQKKAVEKFAFEFEESVKNGDVLDGRKLTLADFYCRWIEEYVSISLEPTTAQWYADMFEKKILPALGHLKMQSIKPLHIQTFLNDLSKPGARADGKAYAPSSVKKYYAALSSLLSKAVDWQIIESNPVLKTTLPKQKA
ncbi:MAG: hypothetical protein LUD81_01430 [Clostridiales bacterium]|nr:hypothetical protein [Clostridiales bacterium]